MFIFSIQYILKKIYVRICAHYLLLVYGYSSIIYIYHLMPAYPIEVIVYPDINFRHSLRKKIIDIFIGNSYVHHFEVVGVMSSWPYLSVSIYCRNFMSVFLCIAYFCHTKIHQECIAGM